MKFQDRVDLVFGFFVGTKNAASVVRGMSTAVACLMLIAVLVKAPEWIAYSPMSGSTQRLESFVKRERAPLEWGGEGEERVAKALKVNQIKLSTEQQNIASYISKKYGADRNEIDGYVTMAYKAAKEFRVDPMLVLAVMSIESSFDPDAESHMGAQGLMQVLTKVHKEKFAPFGGAQNAFDPMVNILVGTQILKTYVSMAKGSLEGALKFYVGAAFHPHDGGYGYKVLSERARIQASAAGKPIPAQPLAKPEFMLAPVPSVTEPAAAIDEGRLAKILGSAGERKVGASEQESEPKASGSE